MMLAGASEYLDPSIDLISKLEYTGICDTECERALRDESWKLIELKARLIPAFVPGDARGGSRV